MQSRGIHHLDLVVSDVRRSKRFYSGLLRGLGWSGVLELEGERGENIWYLQAQDTWIGLREKQSDAHAVPYDRYAVGVHHLAFEASSRELVDRSWQFVLAEGVETESAPKEFPHYAPGYYAVFFYDPDGIKLEVVYEPTRAATTSAWPLHRLVTYVPECAGMSFDHLGQAQLLGAHIAHGPSGRKLMSASVVVSRR